MDISNVACAIGCEHTRRQISALIALQIANSAVRLCSQTCRYITKHLTGDSCTGFVQNELPSLLENVPQQSRL